MREEEVKCLVIGAGAAGLCAAHYLADFYRPHNVTLIERSDTVGGLIKTEKISGFVIEWAANGFLDREPLTVKWVKDLGLADKAITADAAAKRRFLYKDGQLHEMKPPPAFFSSKLMSLGGKARLLAEAAVPKRKSEEPESVHDFIARRFGAEAAEIFAVPLVSGIFAGDPKATSMEHAFPRVVAMEREYGSVIRGMTKSSGGMGTLTSFREGMVSLMYAAGNRLRERIRLNSAATEIRHRQDQLFEVKTSDAVKYIANSVVLAVPAHAAPELTETLDRGIAAAQASIPHVGLVVVVAGFRREHVGHDLNGFGCLIPRNQAKRALGCLWSSSIFPQHAPEGYVMLRAMYGGALDPEVLRLGDREILEQFLRDFKDMLHIKMMPEYLRIIRHRQAIPQYTLEHGRRLKTLDYAERHFKGLKFVGNAYHGVGVNDCVAQAHRAVKGIMDYVPQ